MKRKVAFYSFVALIVLIAFGIGVYRTLPPSSEVTVVFLGYTNGAGAAQMSGPLASGPLARLWHGISETSDRRLALFQLKNDTKHTLGYLRGEIQVRNLKDSAYVAKQLPPIPFVFLPFLLSPAESITLPVPVPSDGGPWRCSITLGRVHFSPEWQYRVAGVLRRAGIPFNGRRYTVRSSEIDPQAVDRVTTDDGP